MKRKGRRRRIGNRSGSERIRKTMFLRRIRWRRGRQRL
jgi:hypothetical protein